MSDYAWKKENTRFFSINFNKNVDKAIIDWLLSQPSKNDYIRQLIKADMESKGIPTTTEAE